MNISGASFKFTSYKINWTTLDMFSLDLKKRVHDGGVSVQDLRADYNHVLYYHLSVADNSCQYLYLHELILLFITSYFLYITVEHKNKLS